MPLAADLAAVSEARFVSLTTFRRSGVPVSTPVWIVRDGDALLVTTLGDSGKVKRLRNNPRVELRPCSRSGKVADDAVVAGGTAIIRSDDADVARGSRMFLDRYRLEYRVFMVIERLFGGTKRRVMLRISSE